MGSAHWRPPLAAGKWKRQERDGHLHGDPTPFPSPSARYPWALSPFLCQNVDDVAACAAQPAPLLLSRSTLPSLSTSSPSPKLCHKFPRTSSFPPPPSLSLLPPSDSRRSQLPLPVFFALQFGYLCRLQCKVFSRDDVLSLCECVSWLLFIIMSLGRAGK